MNRNIIHNAIEGQALSAGHVDELAEISKKYPYFSSAHILLARAYRGNNDYRFTDQVHQAALYASDRSLLYRWVKDYRDKDNEEKEAPVQVSETAPISPVAESAETSLASLLLSEEEVSTNATVADNVTARIENLEEKEEVRLSPEVSSSAETNGVAEEEQEIEEIEATQEETLVHLKASDLEPMEREILLEAVQSSIELEVGEKPEESPAEDVSPADDIPLDENSYAAYVYRRSKMIASERSEKQIEASGEEESIQEEDLPAFEANRLSHGIQRIRTSDEKDHQRQLIDRFIRLEPNISRGKSAEFTPGNIARESLEEDFSLVTETMAVLFAKQGKLDKARKVYKKLIELHPEKSIYFAAQLKNLDKLKK